MCGTNRSPSALRLNADLVERHEIFVRDDGALFLAIGLQDLRIAREPVCKRGAGHGLARLPQGRAEFPVGAAGVQIAHIGGHARAQLIEPHDLEAGGAGRRDAVGVLRIGPHAEQLLPSRAKREVPRPLSSAACARTSDAGALPLSSLWRKPRIRSFSRATSGRIMRMKACFRFAAG